MLKPCPLLALLKKKRERKIKDQNSPTTSGVQILKRDTTQSIHQSINQSVIDHSIPSLLHVALLLLLLDADVSYKNALGPIFVRSRSGGHHHDSMVGAQPRKERHAISEPVVYTTYTCINIARTSCLLLLGGSCFLSMCYEVGTRLLTPRLK